MVLPTKNNRVRGEWQSTIATMDDGLELGREGNREGIHCKVGGRWS